MFSLFGNKKQLFLAAVERSFEHIADVFTQAAEVFDPAIALPDATVLQAMGNGYMEMLRTDRDYLMIQHQAYAACDDDTIRDHVRRCYAELVAHVERLSGAEQEELDDFFRYGMWLNVAAAMGVEDLSAGCEWMREELTGHHDAA